MRCEGTLVFAQRDIRCNAELRCDTIGRICSPTPARIPSLQCAVAGGTASHGMRGTARRASGEHFDHDASDDACIKQEESQ